MFWPADFAASMDQQTRGNSYASEIFSQYNQVRQRTERQHMNVYEVGAQEDDDFDDGFDEPITEDDIDESMADLLGCAERSETVLEMTGGRISEDARYGVERSLGLVLASVWASLKMVGVVDRGACFPISGQALIDLMAYRHALGMDKAKPNGYLAAAVGL